MIYRMEIAPAPVGGTRACAILACANKSHPVLTLQIAARTRGKIQQCWERRTPYRMASNGAASAQHDGHADEYKNHQFPPGPAAEGALVSSRQQYDEMHRESIADPDKFWSKIAEGFVWRKLWQNPVRR